MSMLETMFAVTGGILLAIPVLAFAYVAIGAHLELWGADR
jgi:hypothetical protein